MRYVIVLVVASVIMLLTSAPAYAQKKHAVEEKGIKSINSDVETRIKFVNKSKQTIKVYWLDKEGKRKLYATLVDGKSFDGTPTFLTHPWLITDANDDAWHVYFPDAQPRTIEIVAPAKCDDGVAWLAERP
jgi:competence protein ComGC